MSHISWYGATKVTPFDLIYRQEVVLPIEINLGAYKLEKQNNLFATMYHDLTVDNNDKVMDKNN